MQYAQALGILTRERKHLVIPVKLRHQDGRTPVVDALVDSGAEVNIVSPKLAKQLGWKAVEQNGLTIRGVDGQPVVSYGKYQQTVEITDSWQRVQKQELIFYAADSSEHSLIIGFPWLEAVDPQISFRDKKWSYPNIGTACPVPPVSPQEAAEPKLNIVWRYPFDSANIKVVTAKELAKVSKQEDRQVYAAIPTGGHGIATVAVAEIGAKPLAPPAEVPSWLADYADVFDIAKAGVLPAHSQHSHAIELEGGQPPYGPLYNLSVKELEVLRAYLDDALLKGWIRPSTSPAGAPILFVPKKDGGLRLCVDYRGLNKVTKKNRYPLPLISETLDRLVGAKKFTKLDLKDAYHRLRIKEGDEWKTAFRTRYGHFEYLVMPFGLTNAPSTFQAYINHALSDLLDTVCVVYLDDILIFSHDESKHHEHVKMVLERLRKHGLYANLKKCQFETSLVEFLGFIVDTDGIKMDPSRVSAIKDWPAPSSVRELQVFLGFANFYRRFVTHYSKIVAPMTDLLKGGGADFAWGDRQRKAFDEIKAAFTQAPILRHFDPTLPIFVETDASGFAIAVIISQPFTAEGLSKGARHPIAFWSRKLSPAEANYETHDAELLAIVQAFKQFRHYLEGSAYPVTVLSDHNNLRYFMTTKELNGRQARWAERLARFDFRILHRPGKTNPADAPSRRPDYEVSEGEKASIALPTLQNMLRRGEAVEPPPLLAQNIFRRDEAKEPSSSMAVEELASAQPALLALLKQSLSSPIARESSDDERDYSQVVPVTDGGGILVAQAQKVRRPGTEACTESTWEGRHLQTGQLPASTSIMYDFADAGQQLLEPPAGFDCCSDRIPRRTIVAAVSSLTAIDMDEQPLLLTIRDAQQKCTFAEARIKELELGSGSRVDGGEKGWRRDPKGILRFDNKVYVPTVSALRDVILMKCHDDTLAGHFGVEKTRKLVEYSFYWPTLKQDVKEYVDTCPICQRTKAKRHRPYGELASLPQASEPWQEISMDFITDLPPSNLGREVYDAILVVVDRFTKTSRYFATTKDVTAEKLADLFAKEIVCKYGAPSGIVTDRGSLFTSAFWSTVCFLLRTKRKLSTAWHPQTDGQTERQNQTLEHYLRSYCNHTQDDWTDLLATAEFAYNAAEHSSTKVSPFQALYGYQPGLGGNVADDVPGGEVPTAKDRINQILQLRQKLSTQLREAVEYQARYYNRKHELIHFSKGQYVLLSTKNLTLNRPCRKLAERFLGPFLIEGPVGKQAYRLKLPRTMPIHPVFHVSLLEPYKPRSGEDPELHDPPIILPDGSKEWELEAILDDKTHRNKPRYLCRWKTYDSTEDSWEPESHLKNAQEILQEYLRSKELKKRKLEEYNVKKTVRKKRRSRK